MSVFRPYTGRVIGIYDVAPDTRTVTVEIDNRQRLPFLPGQYVRLGLPGFESRPFSIASAPHEPHLEFHIKSSGTPGSLSAHIVEALQPGSPLQLEGPLGEGHWRPTGRPLLAMAGGLGIAPMKSIVEAALHDRAHPPVHLYWGARQQEQLYLDAHFRDLSRRQGRLSYIPVLSDETGASTARRGTPGRAVAEDFDTLAGFSIYMAGPPAMVEALLPQLLQKGAEEDYIFSDAFRL